MGKHSKIIEKRNKNTKKRKLKILILLVSIILVILIGFAFQEQIKNQIFKENQQVKSKEDDKYKEKGFSEQLVLKSTLKYNRILTFQFKNDIVQSINIYEQYKEKEEFLSEKKDVELMQDIEIININEENLSIEIKKNDLGEDKNKSYEEICDKYLNQLIGMYEINY